MLPALIVGAWTAWHLGLRVGIIAAVATAAALLAATVIPGMSLTVYALIVVWGAGLYFLGPKLAKASGKTSMASMFGGPIGTATGWVRKMTNRKQ